MERNHYMMTGSLTIQLGAAINFHPSLQNVVAKVGAPEIPAYFSMPNMSRWVDPTFLVRDTLLSLCR